MTFNWFFIFNKDEFESLALPSATYTVILDGIGQKEILVSKGNLIGMTYEGQFLTLNMNDDNPFAFGDNAIFVDENNNVWLGVKP